MRYLVLFLTSVVAVAQPTSRVPFVGCKSDGQLGAVDSPTGEPRTLQLTREVAQQLAFYKSGHSIGVVAPRGWYCFGTYGSGGDVLYVSPQPIETQQVFSTGWGGFSGPVVVLDHNFGDTSGRVGVASVVARVFPDRSALVREVEKDIEGDPFPTGSYPTDRVMHKGKDVVEFETPPYTIGLGNSQDSALHANADPINGAAMLVGDAPDLMLLSVRLSAAQHHLAQLIIQQFERDARAH